MNRLKLVSPKEVPRSWEDFLDPKWKGKISVEVALDIFIALTKTWGEEKIIAYLKKLREQNPIFTSGATNAMILLGSGEFFFSVDMNLHRALDLQERGISVAWVPLSPIIDKFAPYVAVRNAPHPNAAKLYLRWLMTAEGQSMVDKIRKKGNPLPGSGTVQSTAIEKMGLKVMVVPQWEMDSKKYQLTYLKALGFTKESRVIEEKKK